MSIYIPYTYLIRWSKLRKYYYGVRYKQGCHPNGFWKDYFTSSPKVAEYRELHGEPDIIQIRRTFTNANDAIAWEAKVLRRMNVIKEDHWLNQSIWPAMSPEVMKERTPWNTGMPHPEKTKQKISESSKGRIPWNKGKIGLFMHSEESKHKISEANKGKLHSEETKRKISKTKVGKPNGTKGKPKSTEHKKKIAEANRGQSFTLERRRKISQAKKGKSYSKVCCIICKDNRPWDPGNFAQHWNRVHST